MQHSIQDFILDKIDDLKGQDSVVIDVRGKSPITETMIICTGTSKRHVSSIAEHLTTEAKKAGYCIIGSEGEQESDWIVVDLDEVIVHIMQDEARSLYELEKLWG